MIKLRDENYLSCEYADLHNGDLNAKNGGFESENDKDPADKKFEKGQYTFQWNIAEVNAGIFFLHFDTGSHETKHIFYVVYKQLIHWPVISFYYLYYH